MNRPVADNTPNAPADASRPASPGFWDYALAAEHARDDGFGTFIRLIGRRTLARPREINSAEELRSILKREGVHIGAPLAVELWDGFCRHRSPPSAATVRRVGRSAG
jgi:hypothetical protein